VYGTAHADAAARSRNVLMMIGWPRPLLIAPATVRATVSVGPPAANGTTKVIACAGYSAAVAGEDSKIAVVAAMSDFLMVDPLEGLAAATIGRPKANKD
jgi:hypothetical protein